MNRTLFALALLSLAACKPPDDTRYKAIIGAVLIDPGSPLVSRSVIVVGGSRIRAVGEQAGTPIPAGSDKVDGSGKFLIPAPVPIPATLPKISTLAEAKAQIDAGASALSGMIGDTEDLDQQFIQKLRDLRVVFVPGLSVMQAASDAAERARRNTKKLAELGIGIAAGPNQASEWQALTQAGLAPAEVLAALSHNAARAAKLDSEAGALQPGYRADIWMLKANPLEDPANLSKIELTLQAGEWGK